MKRTFATLATVLAVAGTTSFMVVDSNTERPVVAADSQSDSREDDHTVSRSETRQPLVSEIEQMAQMKRDSQKAQADKLAREQKEAEKRAKEKKAREAAAKEAERQRLAAAAEKARKQREVNSKPRVTKPKVSQPTQNHVAPGGIAACIRKHESGGNYRALNSSSGASGAYQFLDSTWQNVTGLPGKAMNYSPAQQDAAFWKLWNNGAGANQWVTSGMCGY